MQIASVNGLQFSMLKARPGLRQTVNSQSIFASVAPAPQQLGRRLLLTRSIGYFSIPRPCLPFLYSSGARFRTPRSRSLQLRRLLSTDQKLYIRDSFLLAGKLLIWGWTAIGLFAMFVYGFWSILNERSRPSPLEWSFFSRHIWRVASFTQHRNDATGYIDWAANGHAFERLLDRLEDSALDGAGLQTTLQEHVDPFFRDAVKIGLDIRSKSASWREGYCEALLGLAKAAENMEGFVRDKSRLIMFPAEMVVGPSNPNPRRMAPGAPAAPLEKDVEPAFDSPHNLYNKVLTTTGLNSHQRMVAALAYANWLDHKNLKDRAENMYRLALKIAAEGLPQGGHDAVDLSTGIISTKARHISPNILDATSSMAAFRVRQGDLSAALSIYLSNLRARKCIVGPRPLLKSHTSPPSTLERLRLWVSSNLLIPTVTPKSDGNDSFQPSDLTKCEEAGIMTNVGELVFSSLAQDQKANYEARQQSREAGLTWTQNAHILAESTIKATADDDLLARDRCADCLALTTDNWTRMMAILVAEEQDKRSESGASKSPSRFWSNAEQRAPDYWEKESSLLGARVKNAKTIVSIERRRRYEKSFLDVLTGR